ncbi:hypothetical protein ON010_g7834 [Phytophthora cinnamomi]|nr:hypothetical protein ON010_g7834 [Phytophthora cinnamomi]
MPAPAPDPAPEMTTPEVREACNALEKKLDRDRQGRRQNGRRSKSEKSRLADNQKVLFAKVYKAACNSARTVDYVTLSNSCHFPTFREHPRVLAAMETSIIAEMKAALEEQHALDTKDWPDRSPEWKEELVRVQGHASAPSCRDGSKSGDATGETSKFRDAS